MNQRTSGPLVVGFIIASMSLAHADAQQIASAVDLCERVPCVDIANNQLLDVVGFLPPELDENGMVVFPGSVGHRLTTSNLAVANVLSQLDIDGDGVADRSADTDGDGLPDNWEVGGFEALTADEARLDRVVFFPAPSAIVPGTPPTPIFTRLAVATSALDPDTDGDGLSDFIEVFGLMFIDDDRDGILDAGLEWQDTNGDGLPSPGEFPIDNSIRGTAIAGLNLLHDFDGFVFTDPTNPDTDGDGTSDGDDLDPLINLRAFGNTGAIIVRFGAEGNADVDVDGFGNAMDMGNDLISDDSQFGGLVPEDIQAIDNPANVGDLIDLFRRDLSDAGLVPEAAIEDLLGTDWDGNGLWRITDVRTWHLVIDDTDPPPSEFTLDGRELFARQSFEQISSLYNSADFNPYGDRGIGMGWQDLLRPSGRTQFIPDRRIWAILYAWRMPGFDIDGDGFTGVPNLASTAPNPDNPGNASVALAGSVLTNGIPLGSTTPGQEPFDDRVVIGQSEEEMRNGDSQLDGRIDPIPIPFNCGQFGLAAILLLPLGLVGLRQCIRRNGAP